MLSNRTPFPTSSFAKLAKVESTHWWFRTRNRILLWVLASKIKTFKNFLEIGCGTGFVLEAIRNHYKAAELFGAEYFEEGLSFARERVPTAMFKQVDATTMTEAEQYDVIGAFDVLEHIEHDEIALANLARAIKPGGKIIITVPQHDWLWSKSDEYACHVRRYSRNELLEKLSHTSLVVEYVTSFVTLLIPLMWFSRKYTNKKKEYEPMSEFYIPQWLNKILEIIMYFELILIKLGLQLPMGGSLLVVAKKK